MCRWGEGIGGEGFLVAECRWRVGAGSRGHDVAVDCDVAERLAWRAGAQQVVPVLGAGRPEAAASQAGGGGE